jgi:hypothetical protein
LAQASLERLHGQGDEGEHAMAKARSIIQAFATSIPDEALRAGFLEGATRLMQE